MTNQPIWFKGNEAASWVTRFTVGDDHIWDVELLPFDAAASLAHASGLASSGILTETELGLVQRALEDFGEHVENGKIEITVEDEDCHTVLERYLVDTIGDVGKKIHTGRSRNDQVLAALRLWIRHQLDVISSQNADLVLSLADLADASGEQFLPGYTHMQRAMPSSVSAWALGYAECLCDDLTIIHGARDLINASPLGSAAGYGVPHVDLKRGEVAGQLGFSRVQENVTAVQLSRGKFELAVVHALLQCASTINRLASDITLYASAEFGFVTLDPSLTTGSSIMPQKKNPDIAELARASMHRIVGELNVLIGIPANLPSGYHRDLQYTKASVMRSVLILTDLLQASTGLIEGLSFNEEVLNQAKSPELFATSAALKDVVGGKPFRDAYRDASTDEASWAQESTRDLSDVYQTAGSPGQTNSAGIRQRLDQALNR